MVSHAQARAAAPARPADAADWLPVPVVAQAAGVTPRYVRHRAQCEGWATATETCRGGHRVLVRRCQLPCHWEQRLAGARRMGETVPDVENNLTVAQRSTVTAWLTHLGRTSRSPADATDEFCVLWSATTGLVVTPAELRAWATSEMGAQPRRSPTGTPEPVPTRSAAASGGRPRAEIHPQLWDHFLNHWNLRSEPAIRAAYRRVQALAKQKKLPCASYSTFRRRAKDLDPAATMLARRGPKAVTDSLGPHVIRDWSKVMANDVWFSDHHQLDCIALHEGKRCRPWLTLWFDGGTRKCVGWVLSLAPNSKTVLAAFERGVRSHGIPVAAYMDNGKDYRCKTLFGGRQDRVNRVDMDAERVTTLAELLEITTHYAKPYNARAKPVERFFRTLKDDFCKFVASYCGGSPAEKPEGLNKTLDRLEREGKLPTLAEVEHALAEWIEGHYHENAHAGLNGLTPNVAWEAKLLEKRTAPEGTLCAAFLPASLPCEIGRNGVKRGNDWYWAPELAALGKGTKVYHRAPPHDPEHVHVYKLDNTWICEATRIAKIHPTEGRSDPALAGQLKAQAETMRAARDKVGTPNPERPERVAREKIARGEAPMQPRQHRAPVTRLIQPAIDDPTAKKAQRDTERAAATGQLIALTTRQTPPPDEPVDVNAILRATYQRALAAKEKQ